MPRRLPAEPLTRAEVLSLIRACPGESATGRRNRALLVILWRGGLRVSEALGLRPCDCDLDAGTVRVLRGKGDRSRTVALDPQACDVVRTWQETRAGIEEISDEAPLLCTLAGARLQTAYVRTLFRRLGRRAGLKKRVHPHGLRHTHACELLDEGASIAVISRQLGHSSIATTARYLDHLRPEAVIEFVRGRSWSLEPHRNQWS